MNRSTHETKPAPAAALRRVLLLAVLCLAALAAPRSASAGCGCQKAPPDLAAVRPNATYAGTEVTLFAPSFQTGQAY